MKNVKKLVSQISGRVGKKCYVPFCYAVYVARSYQPDEPSMNIICNDVKELTKMNSASSVSKALSRATEDIWENGNRANIEKIFNRPLFEKQHHVK